MDDCLPDTSACASPHRPPQLRDLSGWQCRVRALAALESDHEFLLESDVFTADFIENSWSTSGPRRVDEIRLRPHPYEFVLYYDL
jgi:hypothetical protein